MDTYPIQNQQNFTWTDYQSWPEGERWEIVGGEAFGMSPTPTSRHQFISMRLSGMFDRVFRGTGCQPFAAPMAVKLSEHDVVEPDLFVVCNPQQIKPTHIEGSPTLVVEILSESSLRHDRIRKLRLYERSGVSEYWLITPYPSLVEVYVLKDRLFHLDTGYEKHETLVSPTFPELHVDLSDIFDFPIEPGEEVVMIRESIPPYAAVR